MANDLDTAARLLALLQAPQDAGAPDFSALLAPDASFVALGKRFDGPAAVQQELLAARAIAHKAQLQWQAPARAGGAPDGKPVLLAAAPADGPDRGLVLTLVLDGGRIAQVQQQRTAPKPAPSQALSLPAALRRMINGALEEKHPMLIAHVDAQGQPTLSFRGSLQVYSDDQLSLWVRNAQGAFVRSVQHNPRVAMMYRNETTKATYQLKGRVRVATDEPTRRAVYDASPQVERDHDFAMAGVALLIDLDSVEGYASLSPAGQVDRIRMLRQPP